VINRANEINEINEINGINKMNKINAINEIKNSQTILVTGGTGFIGSHTVVALQQAGFDVVILDNLSNSHAVVVERIRQITSKQPTFIQGDVRDKDLLAELFAKYQITAVIHFAGLKSVGESVQKPLAYYDNNFYGTLTLCEAMHKAQVYRFIFSSSATVYGIPQYLPLDEQHPIGVGITNPYGQTKCMLEQVLRDLSVSDDKWQIALLRYFNPIGAHPSGLIGEDPQDIPNNLLPYITQVAVGKLQAVQVFGDDYPTRDGSGVRDYLHVVDLARGHLSALNALNYSGVRVWNLGTGKGVSVLEMIHTFNKVTGQNVPFEIKPRRSGDVATCFADPTLAAQELNWQAQFNLEDMLKDAWHWQKNNPNGYLS